ncbi:MFS transporter [Malaciobacter mytili]|uniref:MFS transporter n=1 Tax=Malaciobacter mytili LMG 24559 TaxID=1032238 RepID=A0AAX2ADK6_9BACT|nr:MFS transporter [Malaciobacter mytili]AXH14017.1 major facilitator superfamily transporter [Malaciobacter mytili LMG 24559]RXK15077.1 MFS transporter [Malaciobacter mytili LMG 24559]
MKEIKPLMIITILCASSMMAFLAVVGPIIRQLNLQEWHAGLMVALAGVAWVMLSRFWGKKSDFYGRKNILVFASIGFFFSYLLLAFFVNYAVITPPSIIICLGVLIFTRVMIGVFYSAIPPVSNALIADKVEIQKRTSYMASIGAANGIGMVLGPIIGGVLAIYGLAVPLYIAAILPLIAVFVLIIFLEPNKKIEKTQDTVLKLFDKRIRLPMLASFFTMFCIVTSQVCLGFYILDKFNIQAIQAAKVTGYILSIIGVVFIITQIIVSKLKNISPYTWLFLGSLLTALGYFLVSLISTKIELAIAFSIAIAGLGMIMPAFMAITANNVEAHEQGVAAGTVSASQGLGIIIGPLFSTILYEVNPTYPFIFCSIIFLVLTFVSFSYRKKEVLVC